MMRPLGNAGLLYWRRHIFAQALLPAKGARPHGRNLHSSDHVPSTRTCSNILHGRGDEKKKNRKSRWHRRMLNSTAVKKHRPCVCCIAHRILCTSKNRTEHMKMEPKPTRNKYLITSGLTKILFTYFDIMWKNLKIWVPGINWYYIWKEFRVWVRHQVGSFDEENQR